MKLRKLALAILFISSLFIGIAGFTQESIKNKTNSENDNVDFSKPNGYTDYEFTELEKAYIQPRGFSLDAIKKLPLSQMSDDFIQKMIDSINNKVSLQEKKEVIEYLKNILKTRSEEGYEKSNKKIILHITNAPKEEDKDRFILENHSKANTDKLNQSQVTIKKRNTDEIISSPTKKPLVRSDLGNVSMVHFSNNNNFINVNGLSVEPMIVTIWSKKPVQFVDVSFLAKNVQSGMIYLIKRFGKVAVSKSGSQSFNTMWAKPQIPFGKYKIFTSVRFLNAQNVVVNRVEKYWGNSLNTDYIVFKN